MKTIRKDPLRHARYLALLVRGDLLFGGAAKRRFFLQRLVERMASKFGLYALSHFVFLIIYGAFCRLTWSAGGIHKWRYRRWYWATWRLSQRAVLRKWVDERPRSHPKIIVLGVGSIGDVLQITPVLRELRKKIPTAEIVLLHRSIIAGKVLKGNPNVDIVDTANFYQFDQIKKAVLEEGTADLVVDIKSVTYLVTYTRAPVEYRHAEIDRVFPDSFFRKAQESLALWAEPEVVSLEPKTLYAWPDKWKGQHFLNVLGTTGNLPIDASSALDFVVTPQDEGACQQLTQGRSFVTLQNGVDTDVMNWARVTGQRPTKLLPQATWKQVVDELKRHGVLVIQLGGGDDEAIDGVTYDLRGQTTLGEAAVFLRQAACHVGTEGGLVHLARAVGGKSVVVFGPTSSDFFGYPQNINLTAGKCNSCWRLTRDWYIYCPRGLAEAECMKAHRSAAIVEAVLKFSNQQ